MLGASAAPSTESDFAMYFDSGLLITLAVGIVASLPLFEAMRPAVEGSAARMRRDSHRLLGRALFEGGQVAAMGVLFCASAAKLMASTYNPFVYFRF